MKKNETTHENVAVFNPITLYNIWRIEFLSIKWQFEKDYVNKNLLSKIHHILLFLKDIITSEYFAILTRL